MLRLFAPLLCSALATSLAAHPHVFIDTGFELIVDDSGQLTHVRTTWEYDELYSLLITEDMSLDPDGDGTLTADEIGKLNGFDMQWIEGFNGDLVIANGDKGVPLSGPTEVSTKFEAGRIITTHLRTLEAPIPAGETAIIKAYDPTYYTAYEVTRPVTLIGESTCDITQTAPDVNAGVVALQQELSMLDPDMNPSDAGLPEIGAQMATTVSITCAAL